MHGHEKPTPIKAACRTLSALLGTPNSGKTALFTTLTGRKRMVANWPGVTVDVEVGIIQSAGGEKHCIVDLPGTYGLLPTSPEEELTLRILLTEAPQTLIVAVDSVNPESSLPLLIQALEAFPGRVLIALTKWSLAHSQGVHLDHEKLARETRAPVVVTSALEGMGVDELEHALSSKNTGGSISVDYGVLEPYLKRLSQHPSLKQASEVMRVSSRWLSLQLLSKDPMTERLLKEQGFRELVSRARSMAVEAEKSLGVEPRVIIASKRLAKAEALAREFVVRREPARTTWQRAAELFTHPFAGPVLSILGLLVVFTLVFAVNTGFPLNLLFERLGMERASQLLGEYNLNALLTRMFDELAHWVEENVGGLAGSLLAHGVVGGLGFVLSFLPLIMMMFLALGILEDSGLAPRMAVSLHPLLERFGLTGKSVFPLIMGFGCNVPAVLAMRGLGVRERIRAVFAAPFIPCQARLAVLFAFVSIAVAGPMSQALSVAGVYLVAVTVALTTAFLAGFLTAPVERGRGVSVRLPFIMEVPEVHAPHWRVVWWYVRDNTVHFLRKAGTIVFMLAFFTWLLLSTGPGGVVDSIEESYGWALGGVVSRVLQPLGVGDYEGRILGIAMLNGLIAKEGVLAAIAVSTAMAGGEVEEALSLLGLSGPQALAFVVLVTLYFPCIATLSSMISVLRRPGMVALYAVYSILIALLASYAVYGVLTAVGG